MKRKNLYFKASGYNIAKAAMAFCDTKRFTGEILGTEAHVLLGFTQYVTLDDAIVYITELTSYLPEVEKYDKNGSNSLGNSIFDGCLFYKEDESQETLDLIEDYVKELSNNYGFKFIRG